MKVIKEFRDFAMKGNVLDLAVGVIIGAAFGGLVNSVVADLMMPPIGKIVGGLDFSNLYVSLSDKVDAANAGLIEQAKVAATTQPTTQASLTEYVPAALSSANRIPLVEAKKLGPVIAYGNFITLLINFLIVAFCVFLIVKLVNTARKRLEREQALEAAAPAVPPADVVLLTEIRDLLATQRRADGTGVSPR